MLFLNVGPAEPLLEVIAACGNERVTRGDLPGDGDTEAHAPEFEVFFARNVFGSDDGTARAVVVVCESECAHRKVFK